MRAIVTCECCGYRQAVARPIRRPEQFHVICHGCEGVLLVEVTSADLRQADKPATARATVLAPPTPPAAWAPPSERRQSAGRPGGTVRTRYHPA